MATLRDLLQLPHGSRVAVVGCGGKTTVIEHLAAQATGWRVLIAPTTKILCPTHPAACVCRNTSEAARHTPTTGVQYMGQLDPQTGKLFALPLDILAQAAPGYDLVLMEADGSRGLPCKGWGAGEPVVPPFTTHTIGVTTAAAAGLIATDKTVWRLAEFQQLTGLDKGSPITAAALAAMIGAPGGMFKNAAGQTTLLLNQAEDTATQRNSLAVARLLCQNYPNAPSRILCGSARQDNWQLL